MGQLLKTKKNLSKIDFSKLKNNSSSELENKLYKPLNEFKWKDASKQEIISEAIPHYSLKFSL
ncbi:MAG: hypothetical protein IT232_10695 [Flavobacteriales bacterium]|nr:hypothetical protein [Flavobacteriales bacterium]